MSVAVRSGACPTVVITGASAGIGRATAIAFARRGWAVALLARGRMRLESTRREVKEAGGQALVVPADVADPEAIARAAERIFDERGRLDVWVNNAMATVFGPADGITPEEFKRVSEVTYLGQVYGTLAALKHMRAGWRNNRSGRLRFGISLDSAAVRRPSEKTQGGTQENRPEGRLGEVAALLGAVIGRDVTKHCLCAAPDEWPAGAIT